MEEEPAERVTTHHRSVGKEGLRKRGWRDGGMRGDGGMGLASIVTERGHPVHAHTSI